MRILALIPLALAGTLAARGVGAAPSPDPDIAAIVSAISAARIQRSIVVLTSFKTRHTLSDPLPSGDGIGGAGAWIRAEFQRVSDAAGGRLRVETDEFDQPPKAPAIPRPVRIDNIFATLPGSRPESANRIYIVCAHYDSRAKNILDAESPAPGADDDASGVAAVLETARVMSRYEFGATLIFMTVAGTEQGLVGSAHWAEWAKQKNLAIAGVLNDDIVGGTHAPDGRVDHHSIRLFAEGVPPRARPGDALLDLIRSGGENDTPPRELARAVREIAAQYVPSMKVRIVFRGDRYPLGGDQRSFLERGYPAVRFVEPAENFEHRQENDVTDFVDFIYIADVARLNAATLAVLARAPAPPAAVEIETARQENGATLSWAPNAEPDLAGYRVVWRETTEPFWAHSLDVARDVTRATVPGVSQDDVIFGVEAFDTAGHVSPAAYPSLRPLP